LDARVLSPAAESDAGDVTSPVEWGVRFDNRFARMPGAFLLGSSHPLPDPYLVKSESAAALIGLRPERFADPTSSPP
jgi:hypothetical protein